MIVPSILVSTFEKFESQARALSTFTDLIQIDVMDGKFVSGKSFDEIERINDLQLTINWELHLMVEHPIEEIEKWTEVKNIKRIIFHIESQDDTREAIARIRGRCAQVGIAINPDTPLTALVPYLDLIDTILFMTVHPGQQGSPLVWTVEAKIKELHALANERLPLVAVDGGISADNIAQIKSWGVETFSVGSAIVQAPNQKVAYQNLINKIK